MEIETEMSIYFGNDRVHPVEYKLPVELLVVSMDIYEFVSKMLQKLLRLFLEQLLIKLTIWQRQRVCFTFSITIPKVLYF